jgi:ABC-type uncharacterized transport system permease subunit
VAVGAVRVAFVALAAGIGAFAIGGGSFTSAEGSLLAFAGLAAAAYMFFGCSPRYTMLGLLVLPVLVAAPVIALAQDDRGRGDDLPTPLLALHIGAVLAGFAAGLVAAGLGVAYAVYERQLKHHAVTVGDADRPGLAALDRNALRAVAVAWPALTIGLLAGVASLRDGADAVDATMVVSVVVWAAFGLFLLLRLTAGWRGRRAAGLLAAGAAGVLVISLGLGGVHLGG